MVVDKFENLEKYASLKNKKNRGGRGGGGGRAVCSGIGKNKTAV